MDYISKIIEWEQEQILDALVLCNPKKVHMLKNLLKTLPELSHADQNVIMSVIKVILKFMNLIDDIGKVKIY